MSDEITCPECAGAGAETIGPNLTLACRFCAGRGVVGGDHEPAEDGPPDAPPGTTPLWRHIGAEPLASVCPLCLGQGRLVHLDSGRSRHLVEEPCPACTHRSAAG